jgi:hypothetical protein
MTGYLIVSLISGILFGVLDAAVNANPLAVKLFAVYKPIARTSLNRAAGILIDLAYGFILAGIFLLLYPSLPGVSGWVKGLSFGVGAWFLRVVMGAVGQWMMFRVPLKTVLYSFAAGLVEMLILGQLYGLALRPG